MKSEGGFSIFSFVFFSLFPLTFSDVKNFPSRMHCSHYR